MERKCNENEMKGEGEGEEEEEEALSLCDLPINEENQSKKEEVPIPRTNEIQEDFDFCSFSKESEMCAADEVFYQGQILPLRNSISSEKGLNGYRSDSRSISRCASMDHCYSVGFTSVSSRSSSIRSHQSSSSGSSSSIKSINIPRVLNQFHSHPSPTPQLRLSSIKQGNLRNSNRKSSLWSIFHVGLVTPPEIALEDLKMRRENNNNNKNFGSRNSTSSNSSDFSNVSNNKKKSRFFDRNGVLFGGCKCSANAIETVSPRVVFIKRSASENEAHELQLQENNVRTMNSTKNQHHQQRTRKQALSRHRTFEWLKQLSLESTTDEALLPM
ncbi:J domain-containing protein DDB_G0295729 [Olea europaea var. sylvestris]|uniref:J domain-containing protein DDB_G0295729 n=1 Tax=Olea europaea var. sylvestris TaxID=158386 RepID=UPI000C1D5E28|nr:J domain-containing protein DDB_G0295729 [Olea europaea var. sylvestris]